MNKQTIESEILKLKEIKKLIPDALNKTLINAQIDVLEDEMTAEQIDNWFDGADISSYAWAAYEWMNENTEEKPSDDWAALIK